MTFCELTSKEVVNVNSCCNIGRVVDIEFDECKGCIQYIIVPKDAKLCSLFGPGEEYAIPWCKIIRIGKDIILVDVCLKECIRK